MSLEILLSGNSGFLGKHIHKTLFTHNIMTIGKTNSDYMYDIQNEIDTLPYFNIVIHSAGKAHFYPKNQKDADDFFNINLNGTKNLLNALNFSPPDKFVFISSVSVYGLSEGSLIDENTPLLAKDPYGLSKILAESEVINWCKIHNVKYTILRLPLLVGKNPPGNLGKMIKGIKKKMYFNIDGGKSNKSMVLAEDVAKFIITASEIGGIYHLTDGVNPNFYNLSHAIARNYGYSFVPNIPLLLAKIISKFGDNLGSNFPINSNKLDKIIKELTFSDQKARDSFDWRPRSVMDEINNFIN
jgi:nucleoside-diphosphate-sugar epimerase